MKKILIAALAVSAVLLAACGNNGSEPSVPAEATVATPAPEAGIQADTESAVPAATTPVTAADITAAITAEIEIPSAVEKNADNIGAFYDVDTAAITDMSVLICGSGAYPDELAVFKFTDESSAKAGAEAVQKRLDGQIAVYADYTPDEMYKLDSAFVLTKDEWVIMAACADNDQAREIVESMV